MHLATLLVVVLGIACTLVSAAIIPAAPRMGSDSLAWNKMPIIDGHNDLPWNLKALTGNQLANFSFTDDLSNDPVWNCTSCFTDIPRLTTGKVGAQFWVAYVSCNSQYKDAVEQTLDQIDVIKRLIKAYPDNMKYADSADGIESAIAEHKIASLICVEGGHSIDSRLGSLRLMYEMGARYMTLTHSCNTPWGDSSPMDVPGTVAEHNGLTDWGKTVVHEMNRLGMMVDLSHVSEKTMLDALEVSSAPVIFSHSSAWSICNHHRNVKDNVLQIVKEKKGVVMVNFYSGFVKCPNPTGEKATMEDVVAHINHIRSIAGVDSVGIGGDYDGVDEMPEGLGDVSKYPDLFDRLANNTASEEPWSDEDLQKLSGRNLLRVMRAVEAERDRLAAANTMAVEVPIPRADMGQNVGCRTDTGDKPDPDNGGSAVVPVMVTVLAAAFLVCRL